MKRVALVVSLAAAVITSVIVAHAATLQVDAGVLQTQSSKFEFEPPAPVTISITAYRRTGNTWHAHGPAQATLQQGQGYILSWSGNGSDIDCPPGTSTPLPSGTTEQRPGEHHAQANGTFGFCVDGGGSGLPEISPHGAQAMARVGEELAE